MSTILKALKKVESDSINKGSAVGQAQSPQSREKVSSDRVRPTWRGFHLFIPILVLLAGVGIWRYLISTDSPLEKQPVQTFPIAKQPSNQEKSIQARAGAKPRPNADERQARSSAPADSRKQPNRQERTDESLSAASDDLDTKPLVATDMPKRNPPVKRDAPQESTAKRLEPENTVKESPPMENAGSPKPNNSKAEPWRDAKRLEENQLALQAVAWAPQPEKRMGVIDGEVMREGDDVNGYTVVKIQKQNIIVLRDGKYYRLEFQRR
jgi:FtsZ-interacting cell division protein ZipA